MRKMWSKTLKTVYLYADGHAVFKHEKQDKQAGNVEWVEIHENLGPKCNFTGRVIFDSIYDFSKGVINLLCNAERVTVSAPSIKAGSQHTRDLGLAVGNMNIWHKDWDIDFYEFPGLLSGSYTYQPDVIETWDDVCDKYRWSDHVISKKFPAETTLIPVDTYPASNIR